MTYCSCGQAYSSKGKRFFVRAVQSRDKHGSLCGFEVRSEGGQHEWGGEKVLDAIVSTPILKEKMTYL